MFEDRLLLGQLLKKDWDNDLQSAARWICWGEEGGVVVWAFCKVLNKCSHTLSLHFAISRVRNRFSFSVGKFLSCLLVLVVAVICSMLYDLFDFSASKI